MTVAVAGRTQSPELTVAVVGRTQSPAMTVAVVLCPRMALS
jgi:hypothetical protein